MTNDRRLASELRERLLQKLSPAALDALRACERICSDRGLALYLVGGAVRDLVLDIESIDIDVAIEGDLAPVVGELADATGGRSVRHERFSTASVSGRGFRIDLASTRRERYHHPGALPQVEPATLADDLARRDFTINAAALRLTPGPAEVVDPHRGIADAQSSLVRVLHEASFQDDATRILRAVRYATRLGFKIATQTEALVRRDLSYLGTISGPRLRRELSLLFEEVAAPEGALLAARLGVLPAIHPALRLNNDVAGHWRRALEQSWPYVRRDELGFCLLADPRDEGTAASVARWLHLSGRIEAALNDLVRLQALSPKLAAAEQPSRVVELLDGCSPSAIGALAVLLDREEAKACTQYLQTWRGVKPALTGDDLQALGMSPGPEIGEMLRRLRAERLDGRIRTRDDEVKLVKLTAMKGF